jgi:energy-converting hydrogenase A subunit M
VAQNVCGKTEVIGENRSRNNVKQIVDILSDETAMSSIKKFHMMVEDSKQKINIQEKNCFMSFCFSELF